MKDISNLRKEYTQSQLTTDSLEKSLGQMNLVCLIEGTN